MLSNVVNIAINSFKNGNLQLNHVSTRVWVNYYEILKNVNLLFQFMWLFPIAFKYNIIVKMFSIWFLNLSKIGKLQENAIHMLHEYVAIVEPHLNGSSYRLLSSYGKTIVQQLYVLQHMAYCSRSIFLLWVQCVLHCIAILGHYQRESCCSHRLCVWLPIGGVVAAVP